MSRTITVAALSAVLILTCGAAERSPLEAAFSGTIVSTYPDGRTAELWLFRNGSFSARGRRGDPSSGLWQTKDNKLCLKQSRPFPSPFTYCTPIPNGSLSAGWSAKAVTGEPIQVALVKGRDGKRGETRSSGPPNS